MRPGRLAGVRPEEMSDDQRRLYEEILAGPRGRSGSGSEPTNPDGSLRGPFNAMLLSPAVGEALQRLGAAIRFGADLPPLTRELVILLVAGRCRSAYEQHVHEPLAARLGASADVLAAVRRGEVPDVADPRQQQVLRLAAMCLDETDPGDAGYRAMVDALGERVVFDVTVLVGYYRLLAQQMTVFGVAP